MRRRIPFILAAAAVMAVILAVILWRSSGSPEDYIRDGAFVIVQMDIYNEDVLQRFFDTEGNDRPDSVRVVFYTEEGHHIIMDVHQTARGYRLTYDATRDRFGSWAFFRRDYDGIAISRTEDMVSYYLYRGSEDNRHDEDRFTLIGYSIY